MNARRSIAALLKAGLAVFAAGSASAQPEPELPDLLERSEQRIETALQDYQEFLSLTSEERLELVTQVNALENELVRLRRAEQDARLRAEEQAVNLEELQDRIQAMESVSQYTAGVFSEFLTGFESRIHVSEDQRYIDQLSDIRARLESAGDAQETRMPVFFEAIEAGLDRQEALLGGLAFTGQAITRDGGVKTGTIALIGPTAYFEADDRSVNGVLEFNSGTIQPRLTPLPEKQTAALSSLFAEGQGYLPLDASLGSALVLKQAKGTLPEHIRKGGWVGYVILLLGGLALLIGLFKTIDLRNTRVDEAADVRGIAHSALSEDREKAKLRAESIKGPIGSMLSTGVDFVRADSETILDAMETVIMRYRPKLERFLPFLATTAAVAPLLGLLGTVVGMIKTFTLIEVFGTGDAKSLSSGISEALITTELGLVVAIPALILHGIFSRIMRSRIGAMEQIATEFSRHVAVLNSKA